MRTEILYRPAYAMTKVYLDGGEEVRVEGGAMFSMSEGVSIETKMQGGFLKSLTRSIFGGESFFMNTYKAPQHGGEVDLAPPLPGDMSVLEMDGTPLKIQSGSFIACAMSVDVDASWGGAKTFFSSEGLIMLRATGTGTLVLSSFGAIHEQVLAPGEKWVIDTGHLVAFNDDMNFQVRKVGGIKSTLLSGEGLVVEMTGPGRVLMQTRSTDSFLGWLIPQVPQRSE
jgi:uncharacterized protein (TIGR00266 family)